MQGIKNSKDIVPSESQEQVALMQWWIWQYPEYDKLLFHIPNGGLRNIAVAKKLKREGVKSGVADLFLCIPKKNSHGLFIEMKKRDGGVQTKEQKEFEKRVKSMGYSYMVCYGFEDAKRTICFYINGREKDLSC